MRLWVPSQNGLVTDPPQRHKENAGLPVRSYFWPSASTNSIEPSGASTRYGPFFLTVILTADMRPPFRYVYEDSSLDGGFHLTADTDSLQTLGGGPMHAQKTPVELHVLVDHAFGGKAVTGALKGAIRIGAAEVALSTQPPDGRSQAGGIVFVEIED